jgi:hypothetical protein
MYRILVYTDINITKFLEITIKYQRETSDCTASTFVKLVELELCTA